MIEDIIRKTKKAHPVFGEDLAQEARLAAWQAEQKSNNVGYIRQRAVGAIIDAARNIYKTRCIKSAVVIVGLDEVPEPAALDDNEPEHAPSECDDLALVRDCVLYGQRAMARRLGISFPSMCKRLAKAKTNLSRKHGVVNCKRQQ